MHTSNFFETYMFICAHTHTHARTHARTHALMQMSNFCFPRRKTLGKIKSFQYFRSKETYTEMHLPLSIIVRKWLVMDIGEIWIHIFAKDFALKWYKYQTINNSNLLVLGKSSNMDIPIWVRVVPLIHDFASYSFSYPLSTSKINIFLCFTYSQEYQCW